MKQTGEIFTVKERLAWTPPERILPSQWSERYRVLPSSLSAEPGAWSNSRTPYLVGIMDAIADPHIEEIVLLKPTQVGFTEMIRNDIGWMIEVDPGPTLIVMPSEQSANDLVQERLIPFLNESERLRRHLSNKAWDTKLSAINLDSMSIYMGWSGSPSSLASRPIRYLFMDEIDKYVMFSGKEANPINLAKERTTTYKHRRKIILGSTPTTTDGNIWLQYQSCGDKRLFNVPCPLCNRFQTLKFNLDRLQCEQKDISHIENNPNSVWYVCEFCQGKIYERNKNGMLVKGRWLGDNQSIDATGNVVGETKRSKKVGFWINSLYSPWKTFAQMMVEYLRSKDNISSYMNFKNSWLAEPWEESVASRSTADVRKLVNNTLPVGICPSWTHYLVASADTQKNGFYYTIMAFGPEKKFQLVYCGVAGSFDELHARCLMEFPVEGSSPQCPTIITIDSGGTDNRPTEVYQFAQTDKRIFPVKGANMPLNPPFKFSNAAKSYNVPLYLLDTNYYKDVIDHALTNHKFLLGNAVTDEFINHLASEHRTRNVTQQGVKYIWKTKTQSISNHFLDCTVYALAANDILQSVYGPIPDEATILKGRQSLKQQAQQIQQQQNPVVKNGFNGIYNKPSKY